MGYRIPVLVIVLSLLAGSCRKTESFDLIGPEYFDYREGGYRIYQVDSIRYSRFSTKPDTVSYQIRELVTQTFTDLSGRRALRLEQWRKNDNDTLGWRFLKVLSASLDSFSGQIVEDNRRFVKLIFPVTKNRKWNGNMYNDLADQEDYKYTTVFQPWSNPYVNFASTVQVTQRNLETFIITDQSKEIYARNVGLVHREISYLNKQSAGVDGYELRMTLIKYLN